MSDEAVGRAYLPAENLENAGDAVEAGELRRAVAQRQKVNARLRALEDEKRQLEKRIGELEAAPRFTAEAAEQAKKALLAAAAGQIGACNGQQVAALLADRFVLEQADGGQLLLSHINDGCEAARDDKGDVLRDPRPIIRDFLSRPGNENLILPARREEYQQQRQAREDVERHMADPPKSVEDLAKLSPPVRQAVLDGMTPEQRAALVDGRADNWL